MDGGERGAFNLKELYEMEVEREKWKAENERHDREQEQQLESILDVTEKHINNPLLADRLKIREYDIAAEKIAKYDGPIKVWHIRKWGKLSRIVGKMEGIADRGAQSL